jgi:zinc transporter 1/2/3
MLCFKKREWRSNHSGDFFLFISKMKPSLCSILLLNTVTAHLVELGKLLSPEQRKELCSVVVPDLRNYSVPLRILTLIIVFIVSVFATVIPLVYRRSWKPSNNDRTNVVLSNMKMFGTGILIATAFIHMLPPAVEMLRNPCLPDLFILYENWPGTIFLIGFLFSHLVQQAAGMYMQYQIENGSKQDEQECLMEEVSHTHVHHLHRSHRENSILANVLEFGLCSHSIVVGFTLGTVDREFSPLFYAILIHQFFEGMALSSVLIETELSGYSTLWMVLLYSASTPIGVFLGILFRSVSSETVPVQLAIGISEAFCAGVLSYDSIGNLLSPHFFGEYYHKCNRKEQISHIVSLWFGVIAMTILGIWA